MRKAVKAGWTLYLGAVLLIAAPILAQHASKVRISFTGHQAPVVTSSFTTKCAMAGNISCWSFDSSSATLSYVNGSSVSKEAMKYVWNSPSSCDSASLGTQYVYSGSGATTQGNTFAVPQNPSVSQGSGGTCYYPSIDTSTFHSGTGSLHISVPTNSDSQTGGYFTEPFQGLQSGSYPTWGIDALQHGKALWMQYYYRTHNMNQNFNGAIMGIKQMILFPEPPSLSSVNMSWVNQIGPAGVGPCSYAWPSSVDGSGPLSTSGAGSTTLVTTTNSFGSALVGLTIKIAQGTNFVAGNYVVSSFTDSNHIVLSTSPTPSGAGSNGYGSIANMWTEPVCDGTITAAFNYNIFQIYNHDWSSYNTHESVNGDSNTYEQIGPRCVYDGTYQYASSTCVKLTDDTWHEMTMELLPTPQISDGALSGATLTSASAPFVNVEGSDAIGGIYIAGLGPFSVSSVNSTSSITLTSTPSCGSSCTGLTVYIGGEPNAIRTRQWIDGKLTDDYTQGYFAWANSTGNVGFGNFELTPQATYKNYQIAHTGGDVWYDDLIFSTQPIPLGDVTTSTLATQVAAMSSPPQFKTLDGTIIPGLDTLAGSPPMANAFDSYDSQGIISYSSKAVWDPVQRRLYIMGSAHGNGAGIIIYDERTNGVWVSHCYSVDSIFPCHNYYHSGAVTMEAMTGLGMDAPHMPSHLYEQIALDPNGRKLYYTFPGGSSSPDYLYDTIQADLDYPFDASEIDGNSNPVNPWSFLKTACPYCPTDAGNYGADEFFPDIGPSGTLVQFLASGEGGYFIGYDVATNTWGPSGGMFHWSGLANYYAFWLRYNAIRHEMYAGGGYTSSACSPPTNLPPTDWNMGVYKFTTSGAQFNMSGTVMDNSPNQSGEANFNNSVQAIDPVSGLMHVFYTQAGGTCNSTLVYTGQQYWVFHPANSSGTQWVQNTSLTPSVYQTFGTYGGVYSVNGATNQTLGITMYPKYTGPHSTATSATIEIFKAQ